MAEWPLDSFAAAWLAREIRKALNKLHLGPGDGMRSDSLCNLACASAAPSL